MNVGEGSAAESDWANEGEELQERNLTGYTI